MSSVSHEHTKDRDNEATDKTLDESSHDESNKDDSPENKPIEFDREKYFQNYPGGDN